MQHSAARLLHDTTGARSLAWPPSPSPEATLFVRPVPLGGGGDPADGAGPEAPRQRGSVRPLKALVCGNQSMIKAVVSCSWRLGGPCGAA